MNELIAIFEQHGFVLELLACTAAVVSKQERRTRLGSRLAAVACAVVAVLVLWSFLPRNASAEGLRTFLLWVVATAGIWLCFALPASWAVFYAAAAGTMQHIIYRGAKLAQSLLYILTLDADFAWNNITYFVMFVLLFAVCYLAFVPRLHSRSLGVLPGRTITLVMVCCQLSINVFVNLFNVYSSEIGLHIFTLYSLFDETTTILLFYLLCEILERSDAERDNVVLQQLMRQQRQQLELSKETVELINIKCHDIKKQLYTLGGSVSPDELEELKKAVDIYDSAVKTGNETLDVLLAERSIVCKGRGIQLDYIVDGAKLDFFKPGEIYSLFGNALDNAIEAVTPLEPERRYIGLQVHEERGMLLIRMENCTAGPLSFVDGLPKTTKGDPRWHGFGVKSIRRIVQQHGGTLTMQTQEGMFRMAALLPLP